jgi:hypothetical protein
MGKVKEFMAKRCDVCPMCNWARANPEHKIAKAIAFHGKFCPFWRAWEEIYGDKAVGEEPFGSSEY